jgi:hypothetical protein
MMDRLFSKLIFSAALLTSGGQAFAQNTASETVRVDLTVDIEQSIGLDLGGDAVLNSEEDITDDRNGLSYTPRAYKVRTGFTTGCLTLTGVTGISVKVTGLNPGPLGTGEPYLISGNQTGPTRYLSYVPVLAISLFGSPPSTNFSAMFQERFRTVSTSGFWFYDSFEVTGSGLRQVNGKSVQLRDTTGLFDALSCEGGPNIAFGAMVGVDAPVSLNAESYRSIDQFLDAERANLAGSPGISFTDMMTVEITPTL